MAKSRGKEESLRLTREPRTAYLAEADHFRKFAELCNKLYSGLVARRDKGGVRNDRERERGMDRAKQREEEREGKRDIYRRFSRGGKRSKARKRRERGERRRQRLVTGMAKQRREGIQREEISSERRDSVRILYNRSTVRRPTKYYYVQLRNDKRYPGMPFGRADIKWRRERKKNVLERVHAWTRYPILFERIVTTVLAILCKRLIEDASAEVRRKNGFSHDERVSGV